MKLARWFRAKIEAADLAAAEADARVAETAIEPDFLK